MAFVANSQNDEEEQKNAAQGPVSPVSGGASVHLAPSSGVVSGGGGGGTAGAPKQDAGGSFASLDKYITANQGQAAPLANKITSGINDKYSALDKGNQDVTSQISADVSKAYTPQDQELLAKEAASPVSFAQDSGNIEKFQGQLTDQFNGPNSAEGDSRYQSQLANVNNAISQGEAQTKTEAGRTDLLRQNEAAPTQGVTALNSAILSENPEYLGQVENAYKPFQNLVSGLGTAAQGVDKSIGAAKSEASAANAAANKAINDQITGLNTGVQSATSAAQKAAADQNTALKQDLTTGKVSTDDLKALGMTQEQWDSLSGAQKAAATSTVVSSNQGKFGANTGTANIDLSQWLTQQDPTAAITNANVATAPQYEQAAAFQKLLAGLNTGAPLPVLNATDASQAGTAPTNLNTFAYNPALSTTQGTAADERTAAQAYVDALQAGADEEHAQLAAANAAKNAKTVGTAGLISTPLAATTAAGAGAVGAGQSIANQVQNTISSPTNAAKNVLENIATGGLSSTGQAIAGGVTKAVNTVTNMFCFHPLTPVMMADGQEKPIDLIQLGDETLGGRVLAVKKALGGPLFDYRGVFVTGSHAVKHNGSFVRVEQTGAASMPYSGEVVNLTTSGHRIWVNSIEFTDEVETDGYEWLNMNESLRELNAAMNWL